MLSFRYILTIACPDRVGIVAAVSGVLAAHRGNIVESNQFSDTESGRFFMRLVFDLDEADESVLLADFTPLAQAFEMDWRRYDRRRRPRVRPPQPPPATATAAGSSICQQAWCRVSVNRAM